MRLRKQRISLPTLHSEEHHNSQSHIKFPSIHTLESLKLDEKETRSRSPKLINSTLSLTTLTKEQTNNDNSNFFSGLQQLKAMEENAKIAQKAKNKYEEDQKKIFDKHLTYISRTQSNIDKLKNVLITESNLETQRLIQQDESQISSHIQSSPRRLKTMYGKDQSNKVSFTNKPADNTIRKGWESNADKEILNLQDKTLKRKCTPPTGSNTKEKEDTISLKLQNPDLLKKRQRVGMFGLFLSPANEVKEPQQSQSPSRRSQSDEDTSNKLINLSPNQNIDHSKSDSPISKFRNQRKGLPFQQFEDLITASGQICSNSIEKFLFFKNSPLGSLITMTKKYIEDDKPEFSLQLLKEQKKNSSVKQLLRRNQTKEQSPPQGVVKGKKPKQSEYESILAKQDQIQKAARQAQESKFCVMSKRMSAFFNDENNMSQFEQFTQQCRDFRNCVDLLFKFENNLNKNLNFLIRLTQTKPYFMNEILDSQFRIVHQSVIDSLENVLVSENTLKRYFTADQTLKQIMSEIYSKDLIYVNSQFEIYLNKQQVMLAQKFAHIIQAEYQMVKQKEKDIIFDQLGQNGIQNMLQKKSYTFFKQYLYNIQPRRNTYQEILHFEKNFGPFSFLNKIERDMFLNLEKSFEEIRTTNKD